MVDNMRGQKDPQVAILVLNWNNYSDTHKCLQSLQELTYSNTRIILVDNGSDDGSREKLQAAYPGLTMLVSEQNLGFAGGNNIGLREILEEDIPYTLLLNNDTELSQPDFLESILNEIESDEDICAVGPKVLRPDGSPDQVILPYPFLGNTLLNTLGLYRQKLDRRQAVDSLIGCCVLVRMEAVRRVGLLDENYFMYVEETEWFYRMRKAGWQVIYLPVDSVIHKGGSSSRKLQSSRLYVERRANVIYTLVKHHQQIQAGITAILMVFLLGLRILWSGIMPGMIQKQRYSFSTLADLIRDIRKKWILAANRGIILD